MGWSAWEVFRCTTCEQDPENCLSERLIQQTTDAMVAGGFRDAGYKIVWIDDCWQLKQRRLPCFHWLVEKASLPLTSWVLQGFGLAFDRGRSLQEPQVVDRSGQRVVRKLLTGKWHEVL